MAKKFTAGLLLFRRCNELEVLLIHPGGPFWAKKDLGAWSLPKGQIEDNEAPLDAAQRELSESIPKPPAPPGLLLFRRCNELEVLLIHPGGPFWAKKDLGAWSLQRRN